jgi:hypothetical protein
LIYLTAFDDGLHLSREVNRWFDWYNQRRPHQALDYRTPNQVYQNKIVSPLSQHQHTLEWGIRVSLSELKFLSELSNHWDPLQTYAKESPDYRTNGSRWIVSS